LADGHTIVLEVDGAFHVDVLEASSDARRSRRLTSRKRTVVRCTAHELIHEMIEVAADLIVLGVPGRLPPGLMGPAEPPEWVMAARRRRP